METLTSARTPALKSASAMHPASVIEVPACMIEGVVIGEDSTVGNVGVMVVNNRMMSPVGSPMVPAPAEPAKIADSKAKANPNRVPGAARKSPGYEYQPGQIPIGSPYASQGSYSGT